MAQTDNTAAMDQNNIDEKEKIDKSTREPKPLSEKVFKLRNSLLTDLFESNPHIKTIHHIFIATLMCLFVNTVAHDYFKKGVITLGFRLIYIAFGKVYIAILSWLAIFLSACFCYVSFILWATIRITLSPKSPNIKLWDNMWLVSLVGYYIFSFRVSSLIVVAFKLPPASAAIVLVEQVRLLMKVHAFTRSNAPRVLLYKTHSDQNLILPTFSKFLYFLFAPTLVYRDEYPRSERIRWSFVMYRTLEILGVILYYSFLLDTFLLPIYQDFGVRTYTWNEIIVSVFENAIIGVLILLSTFFLILHSVQNLFAELLRFGDRMFYMDWWTCTSYSEYFRTWNIVVHDWLYAFIYKDMYEIVLPRNKTVAKFTVFIISAVVHEWILIYMFGFFFPALFVHFFFGGGLLSFIKTPKITILNILFWYGLAFGSGILVSLYTLEYYARNNTHVDNSTVKDFLLPRWLTCDCIE